MIQFELPENNKNSSIIKVIGVGGGGGNAVNYMHSLGIEGVDFIVCNTDQKALNNSTVPTKVQLGPFLTRGLGAGANPEVGMRACEESIGEIENILANNTKMVFVTAGMGGGTGTGGAPIVAQAAKNLDILTVGIVTTPFSYEGKKRMKQAKEGIEKMRENVDTILIISNDKLRHQFGNIPASQAFSKADDILATATKCITDVINSQGHIVVDFADVCTVMKNGGAAILGSATASGVNRAYDAVESAINSPLLNDFNIKGAKWVLLNVNSAHGIHEHTLDEVEIIQGFIEEHAGEDCDVIFGTGFDDNLDDKISVTIIATGFEHNDTEGSYNMNHKKPSEEHNKVIIALDDEEPIQNRFQQNLNCEVANDLEKNVETIQENQISNIEHSITTQVENITSNDKIVLTLSEIVETPQNGEMVTVQTPEASLEIIEKENQIDISREKAIDYLPLENETTTTEEYIVESTPQSEFNVQAELDELFQHETKQEEQLELVEKTPEQMEHEFVTINGITLNRRKGNRLLTDMELEAEANFELQKRALEERASKLRSISFNVNNADIENNETSIPTYQRNNISLESYPNSGENTYNNVKVSDNKISTLNSFLNGNNPD